MKKVGLSILILSLLLLLILSSCSQTTDADTSASAETDAATESRGTDESTGVEETEPETAPPETTVPTTEELFVWDETQFPTITSIKIGPNTFTNPNPSKEELSNFLCEVLFYSFSFEWTGYMTPYRIPWDDSITYTGEHGLECYRFDMDYIKSRQYMQSVVVDSYFDPSYYGENGFFVSNGVDDEGASENIYIIAQACVYDESEEWNIPKWDPTLFNYVVTKKTATEISVDIYLYSNTSDKTSDCKITMVYTDDHLWKVTRFVKPMYGGEYAFALREDFGKRLTIEKAD